MAYNDDMLLMLRGVIYDMDVPYTYTDAKLTSLIYTSAKLLATEVDLSDYTIDLNGQTISPDPSDDIEALIVMKAACMLANAESKVYTLEAVSIKDGPSSIDGKEIGKQMLERYKFMCEKFEAAKRQYITGVSIGGRAVLGPIVYGNYFGIEGNTHGLY